MQFPKLDPTNSPKAWRTTCSGGPMGGQNVEGRPLSD